MDLAALGAGQTGALSSSSGKADAKLTENFDTFLKLLTTQLVHQDPLDPMDANQFTEQLVQFSQVEQSIEANKNLEQLLALASANSTADAVSYLGKNIEAHGKTNMLSSGKAEWRYQLPEIAKSTSILISDSTGKAVFSTTGALDAGSHDFVWDGKDNQGNILPDGAYTISVNASNSFDEAIAIENFVSGVVTSIQSDESGVYLMLQDVPIPATLVQNISEPIAAGV